MKDLIPLTCSSYSGISVVTSVDLGQWKEETEHRPRTAYWSAEEKKKTTLFVGMGVENFASLIYGNLVILGKEM